MKTAGQHPVNRAYKRKVAAYSDKKLMKEYKKIMYSHTDEIRVSYLLEVLRERGYTYASN